MPPWGLRTLNSPTRAAPESTSFAKGRLQHRECTGPGEPGDARCVAAPSTGSLSGAVLKK